MKKLIILILLLTPLQSSFSQYKPHSGEERTEKVKDSGKYSPFLLSRDPSIISQANNFENLISFRISKNDDDIENQNMWTDIFKWTTTIIGSITAAILGSITDESNVKNTLGIIGAGISTLSGLGIILNTTSDKQNRIKENGGKVLDNWIKLKSLPDSNQTKINVAAELVSFGLRNGIVKDESDSIK